MSKYDRLGQRSTDDGSDKHIDATDIKVKKGKWYLDLTFVNCGKFMTTSLMRNGTSRTGGIGVHHNDDLNLVRIEALNINGIGVTGCIELPLNAYKAFIEAEAKRLGVGGPTWLDPDEMAIGQDIWIVYEGERQESTGDDRILWNDFVGFCEPMSEPHATPAPPVPTGMGSNQSTDTTS